jgi:predicted AlkP superfamily phosphohydrolase/phosphomutase
MSKLARSSFGRKVIFSSSGPGNDIDLTKTRAMYHSVCSRGIRINLEKKYEHGVVDTKEYDKIRNELITICKNIRDPETKETIVNNVYKWEEIYGENAVNDPLDIILEFKEGYSTQELLQPP